MRYRVIRIYVLFLLCVAVHSTYFTCYGVELPELGDFTFSYASSPVPSQSEFESILKSAEDGDAESQLYMGIFHANGNIVVRDYGKAAEWYEKAAEQGNARAQYYLGYLYDVGIGVECDYAEAFRWYMAAVEQDDVAAHLAIAGFHLAYRRSYMPFYFGDYDAWRSKAIYLSGVTSCEPSFEENLWKTYNSEKPYYQDEKPIVTALVGRSRAGDGEASLHLVRVCYHAQGVSREWYLGRALIRLSADQGCHNGQFLYATHVIGFNSEKKKEHQKYLDLAAETRDEPYLAVYTYFWKVRDWEYKRGGRLSAEDKEVGESFAVMCRVADEGDLRAQFYRGKWLFDYYKKYDEAFVWLKVAAEKGHKEAQIAVGAQLLFGVGVEQNRELGAQYLDGAIGFENTIVHIYLRLWFLGCKAVSGPDKVANVRKWMQKRYEDGNASSALYMSLLVDDKKSSVPGSREWYCAAVEKDVFPAVYFLTIAMVNKPFEASVLDNLDRFGITSSSFASFKEKLGYGDKFFPGSILFLKGAMAGYGPAILEVCYDALYSPSIKKKQDKDYVETWLRKGINHPRWHTIKGSLYRKPSVIISKLYPYAEIEKSRKNNDGFRIIFDLIF